MQAPVADLAAYRPFLPEDRVGVVERFEPITLGLSGAGVYAVTTSRGEFVLRVQGFHSEEKSFPQHLRVLRRASEAGVAPAVVHADEAGRAVVLERVPGVPLGAALANPNQRDAVFASIVDRLRTLHGLDSSDVAERDPVAYARAAWDEGRDRDGFPAWAASIPSRLDRIAATLATDPRRVLSHNDVNPVNVLWDGTRAWLVDWEVAGGGHPYYDLAALAVFLRLDDAIALDLCARHDGSPLDDRAKTTFRALRQLVGLLGGLTILKLVDDLRVRSAPTLSDAPSLGDCYAAMRAGSFDIQSQAGRASFGLALLKDGMIRH